MKYINATLLFIIFTATIFSCKKKYEGYTDWKPINETSLSFKDTVFALQQLDTLKIQPTVNQPNGGNAFKYEWIVYSTSTPMGVPNTPKVISTEKNLSTKIMLSPGSYYLQYKVTDTTSGIFATKRLALTVNGAFYEGWLVPNIKNGKSMLSFIRMDGAVRMDPFSEANKETISGNITSAYAGVIKNLSEIAFFTDKESYVVHGDDFTLLKKSGELYESVPSSYSNPYYSLNALNYDQFIINGGKLLTTITPGISSPVYIPGKYTGPIPILPVGGTNYNLFPVLMAPRYGGFYNIFYDNQNMRFLQMAPNGSSLSRFSATPGAYNIDSVGKQMVNLELGKITGTNTTTWRGEYYAVMKDDANKYYMYVILINDVPKQKIASWTLMNAADIEQAKAYTASSKLSQMYYAVQNKVYLYDVTSNSTRVAYTFPAGTNVKDLEMLRAKTSLTTTNPMYNNRIVVATYNGTEGEVYYFDLGPTGDFAGNSYVQKFGGFGDIVQLNYRNPNEF